MRCLLALPALALFTLAQTALADTIDLSTSTGDWTITGAGATDVTADVLLGGGISFTDNALRTGTFISGASLAAFDGFWTASASFFLPSDVSVFGSFSNLRADDRVALFLNGNLIGDGGLGIPASGSILGKMEFTDGGGDQAFTFNSSDSSGSGSGGFILGGTNTLLAVINNTGSGVTGSTRTFAGDGDAASFKVGASVTFTPVPEPAGLSVLLGACFVALVGRHARQRRI